MLRIIFQNTHFSAVFKPAEALSVPSRTGANDPRPVVGKLLETQLGRKIWPCHRLDEDVSGLLLFALNAQAHRAANQWFEQHLLQKTYQAISPTVLDETSEGRTLVWTCHLMRGKRRAYEATYGKESITEATLVNRSLTENTSLWHLSPKTGRSHQLRYEMMRHNYPIVGDALYQSKSPWTEAGIALRAVSLDFNSCKNAKDFELPWTLSLPADLLFGPVTYSR